VAIGLAISFDSGILLCADTKDRRAPLEPTKIFPKQYGADPGSARSIFLVSVLVDGAVDAVRHCERALETLQPAEFTTDRMRTTIEKALVESKPEATLLVALYSSVDLECSLFHSRGTALVEFAGYDCHGPAAFLGHYMIRDKYRSAESMDSLDLTTVTSIANGALKHIRETFDGSGGLTETIVMYANGHATDVKYVRHAVKKQGKAATRRPRAASLA
jgi:hypothetical protein